jgi:hypothetical protein
MIVCEVAKHDCTERVPNMIAWTRWQTSLFGGRWREKMKERETTKSNCRGEEIKYSCIEDSKKDSMWEVVKHDSTGKKAKHEHMGIGGGGGMTALRRQK